MAKKDYSSWTKEELIRELEKFKKQKNMELFGKINLSKLL